MKFHTHIDSRLRQIQCAHGTASGAVIEMTAQGEQEPKNGACSDAGRAHQRIAPGLGTRLQQPRCN